MIDYIYTAVGKDGKKVKGTIAAANESRARILLKEQGLVPTKLTKQTALNKDINLSFGSPVKPRDLSVFCRQFQSILKAGVTIVDALEMLADQTENKIFAKTIQETRATVQKGSTLAEAMKEHPKIYPTLLVNMVEAGEVSGSLEVALERMSIQFEKSTKTKALVKKAMIYPIMILVVAFVVVIVMSIVVVPKFSDMFKEMGTEMPFMTKIIVSFSDFILHKWYILLAILAILIAGIAAFAKSDTGKRFFSGLVIKLPIFGKLAVKSTSASFARTISTLVGAGVPLSEAIEITGKSLGNVLFQEALRDARLKVEQGSNLSEPLEECGLFPAMIPQMIRIGEETGNIDGMLTKAADYYEEEVEIATGSLTSMIEPLIIVVLGAIVAFLVLALYMPMMSMYSGMENLAE